MAFVFVLLGGMLGGMVAGFPAALIGAVVAPLLWMALRKEKSKSQQQEKPIASVDVESGLAGRVQALEKEVVALRSQVQRLSQAVAPMDDSALAPAGDVVPDESVPASVVEIARVAESSS